MPLPRLSCRNTRRLNQDSDKLTLGNLKPPSASSVTKNTAAPLSFRQGSPGTPHRRPASIRIETEEQRNQRVAKENEKARLKAEAEVKEKEGAEQKIKGVQERKKKEMRPRRSVFGKRWKRRKKNG